MCLDMGEDIIIAMTVHAISNTISESVQIRETGTNFPRMGFGILTTTASDLSQGGLLGLWSSSHRKERV